MFRKLFLLSALFGVFVNPILAAEVKTTNYGEKIMSEPTVDEYKAVKNALNKYLEAGKLGKSEVLKSAFYKDAIMYTSVKGEVNGGDISGLYNYINSHPAAPEIEAEITAVDIAGNVAYARVESNNWHGARFSDMFLLVKEGDEWKILTKVFYTH